MITSAQTESVRALLEGKRRIVIFSHVAPDGDAMGSSLGLRHWLLSAYPQLDDVSVIVPTPQPPFLRWMPGSDDVFIHSVQPEECRHVADNADLCFLLDFNEPKRIEAAEPLLASLSCPKILIDHHLHPDESMADVIISYSAAPAASYLVLELINSISQNSPLALSGERGREQGACSLPLPVATCLYTGLMTDTGNFAFNSNDPELYMMIAELLRAGINKDEIFDSVFNQFSVDRLRFTGYCIYHKMRIFPKYHAALIAISREELKRFNFQSGDAEGIVNMPLQIGPIKYSVFMREDVDKIKMSFRSQGDRPVNVFAHDIFNGGGHKNAAGGESYASLAEAVKLFEDNYQQYFLKD
ncbi:MAG: DHH family phosphoesterase [Bacteroidales bacterium]|nr:DHH family phosphoesterase [Candidatus Colicola faecequi]